jgi:uncharacterized membrane protein
VILSEFDDAERQGRIVLRPNRSWTWRANTYLVATLALVSGTIGVLFAMRGMWLILPFTVLELTVLLGCLYYCVRRTHLQEVLTFSPEYLVFERGIREPSVRRRFQRYFTRFFVHPPPHRWHQKRVALKCRDTELEIGSFLNGDEKERLVVALRDMIQRLETLPPSRARQ